VWYTQIDMKIVVTHNSPDWDAITSVWVIKKFLPGWDQAEVRFVPAGSKLQRLADQRLAPSSEKTGDAIEQFNGDEVIHVDTGLGPLDHHQTQSKNVSAASLAFDFVKNAPDAKFKIKHEHDEKWAYKEEAVGRIVKVVVEIDHFGEVFWDNPTADYHEFSLLGVLEGLKLSKPDDDMYYMDIGITLLEALLHTFVNRIWAEKEIAEHGTAFTTKWGKGMGFLTINDSVLPLAQKMGYVLVIRKDPRKGYVRIKAKPSDFGHAGKPKAHPASDSGVAQLPRMTKGDIDLTLAYEKLRKMDPDATWFLHVSKKMLLNGTVKNPTMKATTLSLEQIIEVLKKV